MIEKVYKVDGMTCSACSSAVERVTSKLEGVESSVVNLTTNQLTIQFDEAQVKQETIFEKIEKAGYKPSEIIIEKKVIIPVSGMTCSSCTQRVEKAIDKLEGVLEVSVSTATNKAYVTYDTQKIRLSEIKQSIKKQVIRLSPLRLK